MAFNLSFTGGNQGVSSPFFLWSASDYNNPFYYVGLIIAVGTITLSWLIRNSRFGLQLLAIRDDEDRARGLGVRTMRIKLTAFVISGGISGMIGGLWWFFIGQALPADRVQSPVRPDRRADGLPGRVRHAGPPGARRADPGAASQQWIQITFTNGYTSDIVLGVLFLAVILFLPRGIVPTGAEFVTRWRAITGPQARARRRANRPPGGSAPPGSPAVQPRWPRVPRDRDPEHGRCADDRAAAHRGSHQVLRRRPGPERSHDRGRAGQHRRADRAERLGQDDAVQRDHRLRDGGRAARSTWATSGSPTRRPTRCSRRASAGRSS